MPDHSVPQSVTTMQAPPMQSKERIRQRILERELATILTSMTRIMKCNGSASVRDLSAGALRAFEREVTGMFTPDANQKREILVHAENAHDFALAEDESASLDRRALEDVRRFTAQASAVAVPAGCCHVCWRPINYDQRFAVLALNHQHTVSVHRACVEHDGGKYEQVSLISFRLVKNGAQL